LVARVVADEGQRAGARRWRGALVFAAAFVLCALPFVAWPGLDLRVAQFLWQAQGDRFQAPTGWFYPIYVGLNPLIYALAGATAALFVANAMLRRTWLGVDRRVAAFVLLSLALGPGLAVDVGLKDYWGRARPRDIVEFGGAKQFTPPFRIADQCDDNCSFVSGHAALAFSLATFAFLAPARRRRAAFAAAGAFGIGVGVMRMLQGAHFLSDVLFAGFVVIGIAGALAWLLLPRAPAR
jgi:lipid A 4'-phosphatase